MAAAHEWMAVSPVPEEIEQEETEVAEIQNHSRLCSLCLLL